MDYGCGTGRYIRQAPESFGKKWAVYAVNIHSLAIKAATGIAAKFNPKNLRQVLTDGR
ncbi:MAG: hypothetical protein WCO44_05685 [Bacteroidota bacterium]